MKKIKYNNVTGIWEWYDIRNAQLEFSGLVK